MISQHITKKMPINCSDRPMIEYWASTSWDVALPKGQIDARRKWKAIVMVMNSSNEVVEYSLTPKNKIKLSLLLDVIKDAVHDYKTEDTKDAGFKIW